MKRISMCFILIISLFIICGCDVNNKVELETDISKTIEIDDSDAKMVCTTDHDYTDLGYVIGSKYVIFADKDNKVTKVISREIMKSNDSSLLDEFENYLNQNHGAASLYSGYEYTVERTTGVVTSNVEIDYSKFNMDKFKEDNKSNISNDINLTVDSFKKQYVSLGATCEVK